MPAVKLTTFLGTAPKISPELLPNTAAQIANNCKLYSGDLIPYPQPVIVGNTGRSGAIKTLFALRDPDTDEKKWLSWLTDVDIAVASKTNRDEQRFYYSGDGKPKVSNYELATTGAPPFPVSSYDLGLPIPPDSAKLTTTAATFTQQTTSSYARDNANIVTIVTSAAHNLRTGNFVSVSGFTYVSGTYSQPATTRTGTYSEAATTLSIMVTVTDHGLQPGAVANLQFSADPGLDGAYTVAVVSKDIFAVTAPTAAARSGNITWTNAGTTTIQVTINNHGLSNGAQVTLDFTSGTAPDGTYTVTNATTNTFDIITAAFQTTSGNVRWDIRNLNAVNVECTVINSTTFTYFSPGPAITTTTSSSGKVDLGGLTQARSYVFTWFTPWEEESIASVPSDNLYIKEGITVTVSNLPTVKPTGSNFVRGVRLYRTLASSSGTEYFLLNTLWFPTGLSKVERTSNVSRVTLLYPHNLGIDDRFKISGCTDASFNITGGIVTDSVDEYTFEYAQVAADVPSTTVGAGTLYHDVSENPPTTTARYWGDGTYNFTDDFDSRDLFDILITDDYDAPPEDLQGLTAIQNNILCGFVGNTLYFSVPGTPHAWPAKYAVSLDYNVVGIVALSGSAFVATDGYPYIVSGSDPANGMSTARIDAKFPCLNKNSLVAMGYGIVYSTHDGLAVYSPNAGSAIITKLLYNNDTWTTALDPTTVIAEYYGENYFASHADGAFVFEQDTKVGGYFVDIANLDNLLQEDGSQLLQEDESSIILNSFSFTASYYDNTDGSVYFVRTENGDVEQWDNLTQPSVFMEWKSKVFVTKDMINLGAARVIADYGALTSTWDSEATAWNLVTATWSQDETLTFRLWVDKQLLFTTPVADVNAFRLPTGYRTDTFEVGVEGNIRVRAIHLAETPLGLREA
jgi:hypothetical protein